MTDKQFAEIFGVSDSTISRALKTLDNNGFITRETNSTRSGKERHIKVNLDVIAASLKLKLGSD